jgi:hypothetical protein
MNFSRPVVPDKTAEMQQLQPITNLGRMPIRLYDLGGAN